MKNMMMKKILMMAILILTNQSSQACDAIKEGLSDNSDCKDVVALIYETKAQAPEYGVSQAIYESSWLSHPEHGNKNLTILLGDRMIFSWPGDCYPSFNKDCLVKSAMSVVKQNENDAVYQRKVMKEAGCANEAWVSGNDEGFPSAGYYHLKQYGHYLVGYWTNALSTKTYFVSDINKDKLNIALPQ